MDINCIFITDPLLFEVTLSKLEKNVQKILQVQSQLLRNQNSTLERLNELESKFKTFRSMSTANTPKAAPRNLFSPKVMSPEWYRDVESPATYHPSAAADVIHLSESQPPILPPDQPILPPNQSPHATTPELQKKQSTTVDSSIINKTNLLPVNAVIAKYPKLKNVGKAGPLAVKLARESFFGDDVLVKCTVHKPVFIKFLQVWYKCLVQYFHIELFIHDPLEHTDTCSSSKAYPGPDMDFDRMLRSELTCKI